MPWDKQFNVEAVLDKAVRAFWARGYEATSMQDLVRQTGVNRASLYATYGDKHALFLAALRMYDGRLRHERLAEIERTCGPREAIRRLLLSFASGVSEKVTPRGCFLTNTALELAGHDAEASRVVAHAQREIEAFFGRMVKKGKATGEFGAHVKPSVAASGLLATLIGLAVLVRSRPEPQLLEVIVDDALRRLE